MKPLIVFDEMKCADSYIGEPVGVDVPQPADAAVALDVRVGKAALLERAGSGKPCRAGANDARVAHETPRR